MSRRRKVHNADGGITEAVWQTQVFGLLRFYGWRFHHSPDNKPMAVKTSEGIKRGRGGLTAVGDRGFPDVVATRRLEGYGPELVVAELKTDRGRYGDGQEAWLADLREVAVELGRYVELALERVEAELLAELAPAIGVYVWRPRDRDDVERVLAGPAGVGLMVDRPADLVERAGVQAVRSLVD